jgi:hypothetical protein
MKMISDAEQQRSTHWLIFVWISKGFDAKDLGKGENAQL